MGIVPSSGAVGANGADDAADDASHPPLEVLLHTMGVLELILQLAQTCTPHLLHTHRDDHTNDHTQCNRPCTCPPDLQAHDIMVRSDAANPAAPGCLPREVPEDRVEGEEWRHEVAVLRVE